LLVDLALGDDALAARLDPMQLLLQVFEVVVVRAGLRVRLRR
jgi:hypothetical protein